ncbi:MAG: ParA family protein [Actinomycetota bacterium]
MSNTVAILNQKGGVGKTTLTLGLASAAWAAGVRTLVVDLDAQANATWALGVDPSLGNLGTGDALTADRTGAAAEMIVPSGWGDDVWLLPAAGDLTERDADTRNASGRRRLAKALKGVTSGFDLVLIDCAPSLGLNTTNGLAAAARAALVVEPSVFGLRGVSPVLDLIEDVWSADNADLDLAGVVLNRVPAVSSAARDRIDDLKKMVGSKAVWTPHIPQRVLVNQAHHERSPIHSFGAQGRELSEVFDALLKKTRRSLADQA